MARKKRNASKQDLRQFGQQPLFGDDLPRSKPPGPYVQFRMRVATPEALAELGKRLGLPLTIHTKVAWYPELSGDDVMNLYLPQRKLPAVAKTEQIRALEAIRNNPSTPLDQVKEAIVALAEIERSGK